MGFYLHSWKARYGKHFDVGSHSKNQSIHEKVKKNS